MHSAAPQQREILLQREWLVALHAADMHAPRAPAHSPIKTPKLANVNGSRAIVKRAFVHSVFYVTI